MDAGYGTINGDCYPLSLIRSIPEILREQIYIESFSICVHPDNFNGVSIFPVLSNVSLFQRALCAEKLYHAQLQRAIPVPPVQPDNTNAGIISGSGQSAASAMKLFACIKDPHGARMISVAIFFCYSLSCLSSLK